MVPDRYRMTFTTLNFEIYNAIQNYKINYEAPRKEVLKKHRFKEN